MFPAARLADITATGDPIVGPGFPMVLICNMPASVVGDTVTGVNAVGPIVTGAFTVLIGGRPASRVTSQVAGVHPLTGIPVPTIVAPPCSITVLLGG